MRRETTNRIRFVLEELLPPIVRDGAAFRLLASAVWGSHIVRLAEFRERGAFITADEYAALYREHPRVHDETDNSEGCIRAIGSALVGGTVCDVGCGTGYLLRRLRADSPLEREWTGVDFCPPPSALVEGGSISFVVALAEALPFADGAFDTVVCTHVLEHLLEPRRALSELRRVARRRLVVVVPREREYRYTFNPHFNFYPYLGSFLRAMTPVPDAHHCRSIGRDIFYWEDRTA